MLATCHTSKQDYMRLLRAHTTFPRISHRPLLHKPRRFSLKSNVVGKVAAPRGRNTFAGLGIHPTVVSQIRGSFPDVTVPTVVQSKFIPAVLQGKDVFLSDKTGTGKTFGLLVALWSRSVSDEKETETSRCSLFLTPHRDLALQCACWLRQLMGKKSSEDACSIQVVLRSAANPVSEQVRRLRASKPRVVIGTPQAVLEVLQVDQEVLAPERISMVVVDEADDMVETSHQHCSPHERARFKRGVKRHPSPTKQILDAIYSGSGRYSPQLVMMSATLETFQREWLRKESGWFSGKNSPPIDIYGYDKNGKGGKMKGREMDRVSHHALVVSPNGSVCNIRGAVELSPLAMDKEMGEVVPGPEAGTADTEDDTIFMPDLKDLEAFETTRSPFNPSALEAIGVAFALDVPQVGLLVLPGSGAVRRAVFELRRLGVNAHGLDVVGQGEGGAYLERKGDGRGTTKTNPTLLVSTTASTRGLDLDGLTHVFLLGKMGGADEGEMVTRYVHMAGRVGRFGRGGKVISVVSSEEVGWLKETYGRLGIKVSRLEHFD